MFLYLFTLGFLASLVSGTAITRNALPLGYGIEDFRWKFPIPGAEDFYVNGTAQKAVAELMKAHPEAVAFKTEENESSIAMRKRADFTNASYNCSFEKYGEAYTHRIQEGIQYLRRLNGQPANGPGPGNCGRVSCSWDSSIWWCNDERVPKTLDGWGSIADGAQFIVDHCSELRGPGAFLPTVHGQVFHSTNWNVIVRVDKC